MFEVIGVSGWQELAEQLLARLGDAVERRGSPIWLRVYRDPGKGVSPALITDDPRSVIGWTAPPECTAVGIVASGHTRSVATGGAAPSLVVHHDGARVRMCCVLARSGEVGWTLQDSGGATCLDAPTEGRMLDSLRRCLGLPTSPPATPASELHAAGWAASVLDEAVRSPKPLTWSDVGRLHPLARLLGGDLVPYEGDPGGRTGDLADLVRVAANAWSWEETRAQACDGKLEALIDARLASWMDEGMFARWVMERTPPLDRLLCALRAYLVPSAARRFEAALSCGSPTAENDHGPACS